MQVFRLVNSDNEILANIIELDNDKAVTSWETTQEPQSVVVWEFGIRWQMLVELSAPWLPFTK